MISLLVFVAAISADELNLPTGRLTLGEKVLDTQFTAVYRVTDEENREFNLRVGVAPAEVDATVRQAFVSQFESEMRGYEAVTRAVCPSLLACDRHSLDVMLAKNVDVFPFQTDDSRNPIGLQTIDEETGNATIKLVVDFSTNILTPVFTGRSLAEEIVVNPFYKVLANRFGLYIAALAELGESVRLLHSRGILHRGLAPENVVCAGQWCEHLSLQGYSRVISTQDQIPFDCHEVFQSSVVFDEVFDSSDPRATMLNLAQQATTKIRTWDDAKLVDWYALGGTLFYILAADRPSVEDLRQSSTPVSDYFLTHVTTDGDQRELAEVQRKITESLLILDGLLQENRQIRLSLDKVAGNRRHLLRKAVAGFIEVDKSSGISCGEFVEKIGKKSGVIVKHKLSNKIGVASFLQDVC